MDNKRFLFLLAWVEGSDSAALNFEDDSGVRKQTDLIPQYEAGNDSVLVVEVFAPNADVADAIAWRYAISETGGSYTLEDTTCLIKEIPDNEVLVPIKNNIEVARFTVTDDEVVEELIDG